MDSDQGLSIALEPPPADKYPNGEVPEGADSLTLVIDPGTSKLLSMTSYGASTTILTAEWTDAAPPTDE